jgi:hypothetical protein
MTATEPHLDITRLGKVRKLGAKIIARCPACHAAGNDRAGEHLVILPSGKFACAAFPGDGEHRREIFALVGIVSERRPDTERDRRWRMARDEEKRQATAKSKLVETAKSTRDRIIERHRWNAADVWHDSPQTIDGPLVELDPRHFISSLFSEDAVIWTGEVFHSGTRHADTWRTAASWQEASSAGPMISPAIWKPGTISRSADNVLLSPYVVLDFDGLDGISPTTPAEIHRHVSDSMALVRWIREGLQWKLAAIVWTGSKSIHAWFKNPGNAALQSLKDAASVLGVDAGLIGRSEHPCRLPGHPHAKTGKSSRVLWLQKSIP